MMKESNNKENKVINKENKVINEENKAMTEKEDKVLTSRDITKLGFRSSFLQASFNYERMQGGGFLVSQLPCLKKIYKDDKKGLSEAMTDNLEFMNTHPNLAGFLEGILVSLEEKKADRNVIRGIKDGLFGPLAGIGDAFFWFTLLPIMAGICSSLAMEGSVTGPIIFFLVYFAIWLSRVPMTHLGYNLGTNAVEKLRENTETISKAATILGVTVVGGLVASYVSINLLPKIVINAQKTVSIQTDFIDKIFPNLLPAAYVWLMYYLLKNKKLSPIVLICITFAIAIGGSLIGLL